MDEVLESRLCSMVAAMRAALFLACSAIGPEKRSSTVDRNSAIQRSNAAVLNGVRRASARCTTSGVPLNVAVAKSTDSQKSFIRGRCVAQSTSIATPLIAHAQRRLACVRG